MKSSDDAQRGRQRHQHVARKAPVGRVDADLPQNLEALTHDVGEVVENLGEVAAGLTLNQDGGHEEFHVENRHALGHLVERVLSGRPKFCWSKLFLNSWPDGRRQFVGAHAHGGLERMPGTNRARQQSSASGNCSSNRLRRADRRCLSQPHGIIAPATAASTAANGCLRNSSAPT